MKKPTINELAIALYQATLHLKGENLTRAINNLVGILAKNHLLSKAGHIIALFQKYAKKQAGIVELQISSARKLDDKTLNKIFEYFGSKVEAAEKIDESILGGVIVQTDDKIFDASLKRQLINLKQQLI